MMSVTCSMKGGSGPRDFRGEIPEFEGNTPPIPGQRDDKARQLVEVAAQAHIQLAADEREEALGPRSAATQALAELFLHAIDDLSSRFGDPARGRGAAHAVGLPDLFDGEAVQVMQPEDVSLVGGERDED